MENLSHASVYEQVRAILGEVLGIAPANIRPESTVVGDLGAQSLDQVTIAVALQHTFGGKIPADGAAGLTTVMDIVDHIVSDRSVESPGA